MPHTVQVGMIRLEHSGVHSTLSHYRVLAEGPPTISSEMLSKQKHDVWTVNNTMMQRSTVRCISSSPQTGTWHTYQPTEILVDLWVSEVTHLALQESTFHISLSTLPDTGALLSAKGSRQSVCRVLHSAKVLTAKNCLPSVKRRALGKDYAESPKNTRQTFFGKK